MAEDILNQYQAFDFFSYVTGVDALAAGASTTLQFTVQQEADFLLTKLTGQVLDSGSLAGITDPSLTVLINDTGSGRNLMNGAVPFSAMFGTGSLPFILPRQRMFVASSVVNITLTNRSNTSYRVVLNFIGEKAFKYTR